jgi:hypothetical protein
VSKAFSAFYDYLMPELPGCTTRMVDLQLLLIAREMCERAGVWNDSLSPIDSEAARTDYPLVSPYAKSEVSRVMRLTWGGCLQWSAIEPKRDHCPKPEERPRYLAGQPPFGLNAAMDTIKLTEQPAGQILIDAQLRPALSATTLPDLLMTQHLETVRMGVLSRLMAMGGKPWSNGPLAGVYVSQYMSALNHGAANAGNGNTRAPMRTARSRF